MSDTGHQDLEDNAAGPDGDEICRDQFLECKLGAIRFGIEVSRLKEVSDLKCCHTIPRMPHYYRGVMELRGDLILTLDLGALLEITTVVHDDKRYVVILNDEGKRFGIVVDDVNEILTIPAGQIDENMDERDGKMAHYFPKIGHAGRMSIPLIDIGKVL